MRGRYRWFMLGAIFGSEMAKLAVRRVKRELVVCSPHCCDYYYCAENEMVLCPAHHDLGLMCCGVPELHRPYDFQGLVDRA